MTRPKEFDASVVQWLPFLRKMAFRMERIRQDREDLVQDTVANAMLNWAGYRHESSMAGWLAFRMRSVLKNKRQKADRRPTAIELKDTHGVAATQESATVARSILRAINDNRSETSLVRLAMGDTLEEIGCDIGVTRERVRQITNVARGKLAKRVGWKVAA